METKENKYQIILLGTVIICAIFTFVTIAWAAFSTTLKISGTATIKAQTWNVYWSAASVDTSTGATTSSNTSIDSIGSATDKVVLTQLKADFDTPGQKAVYDVTISNGGTFDALYKAYTAPSISCTSGSVTTTQADAATKYDAAALANNFSSLTQAEKVCKFITFEVKTKTTSFTSVKTTTAVPAGTDFTSIADSNSVLDKTSSGTIGAGGAIELEVTLYFDKNEDLPPAALPTSDVSVTFSNMSFKFDQA